MPLLVGLPNTTGNREARLARSASAALRALRSCFAVTTAGDNGAINLWRDDDGYYVCEMMRHLRIVQSRSFATKKAAVQQFTAWLTEIE